MKKHFMMTMALAILLTTGAVHAGEFADLHKAVMEARDSLITLMKNKDKRGPAQQQLVRDTADAVSNMIAGMTAPAGKEAQFKEMSDNWAAFKKTRREELVPLILEGKEAQAKAIGMGVQKVRLGKVLSLCNELDQ